MAEVKKISKRRKRVKATVVLTFDITADDPEWAVDDAVRGLHYDVSGYHVDHGFHSLELVKRELLEVR